MRTPYFAPTKVLKNAGKLAICTCFMEKKTLQCKHIFMGIDMGV